MAINAKEAPRGGKAPDPIDPGTYPSQLVQVIDFGLQPQTYNNEEKPPAREIGTTYELADEFLKDEEGNDLEDKPRWLSETFALHNLGSERAKSTARYYALDPNEEFDGDWGKLLGRPAMITVINKPGKGVNKKRIYNNISSTSAMRPKEVAKLPKLKNEPKFFDLSVATKDNVELFYSFPDWIQKKIKGGLEFEGTDFAELLANTPPPKKDDKAKDKKREVVEVDDEIPTDEDEGNW